MGTVSEILSKAADLIEPEGAWTQRAFSRNAEGIADRGKQRWASKPTCFCLRGAIIHAAGGPNPDKLGAAVELITRADAAVERIIGKSAVEFNDAEDRTQAEVVAALRRASKLAEEA